MRRLTILLVALLLSGCAQLQEFYCISLADNSMTSVIGPSGEPSACIERHDGQTCVWPETGFQGAVGRCIPIGDWREDWIPARKELGLPTDVCVYCQDGTKRCPSWATIQALYR